MLKVLRLIAVLVVVLTLTACSAPILKKEQAEGLKTIGVVSLLPEQIVYHKVGITVFNNELITKPIGKLFNASAQSSAVTEIVKFSGRTAKVLDVDTGTLAKRYRSGALVMSRDVERIKSDLVDLAKKNNLDAIVVTAERHDSENGVDGVKILFAASMSDVRAVSVRAGMTISILDANGSVIGSASPGGRYGLGKTVSRPNGGWTYKLSENLDPDTEAFLRKTMQETVSMEVAATLRQIGL
jgi:hypothetical protein